MGQEEERAKSHCSRTTPQKASFMPPSAPFSCGYRRQRVCAKYCCEHWVLSHSAHTANRCYSKKNKTQTYSKREHFSSSPYHEPQAPARRQKNLAPRHMGRGLADHPLNVKLGSGDNEMRLYTSIRSKTPAIWWRGLHISSAQQCSRPACRRDKIAGERSRGNGFPSSERVKLLQPLLPCPQDGWWSKTHSRS